MGWQIIKLQAKADLLKQIHAIEPHQRFHPEGALIDILPIPFYTGGELIRARNNDWGPGSDYLWYVRLPDQDIVALDGSIANIHHLNFHSHLHLPPEKLPAYLKFRLYFGQDDKHRRYLMKENPLEINPEGTGFICGCLFLEERKLYNARFKVSAEGKTELLEKTQQPARLSLKPMPDFNF